MVCAACVCMRLCECVCDYDGVYKWIVGFKVRQPTQEQAGLEGVASEISNHQGLTHCSIAVKTGAQLLSDPYQCCILPNFIEDSSKTADVGNVGGADFLQQLKAELLRLKFYEKNNDLYQFRQVSMSCTCTLEPLH